MSTIKIDDLAMEINKQLQVFAGATDEVVKAATDSVAKITVKQLKDTSPKKTGEYAKSWTKDKIKGGRHTYVEVIHAGNGEYRLTHLLENGHAKRGGGRTAGIPHIKPAEEQAIRDFEQALKRGIEGIK